jgi:hypothetical protein
MVVGCVPLLISVLLIQIIESRDLSNCHLDVAACLLIVATFTTIVITVGVFAYLRHIPAMIVGCLVWMLPFAAFVPQPSQGSSI